MWMLTVPCRTVAVDIDDYNNILIHLSIIYLLFIIFSLFLLYFFSFSLFFSFLFPFSDNEYKVICGLPWIKCRLMEEQ